MNDRIRHLNRVWEQCVEAFGIGSYEVEMMGRIIDYWQAKAEPPYHPSDEELRTEVSGLRNEMVRDQGFQPWEVRIDEHGITKIP